MDSTAKVDTVRRCVTKAGDLALERLADLVLRTRPPVQPAAHVLTRLDRVQSAEISRAQGAQTQTAGLDRQPQ
jgi:hypothetical protein